LYGKIHHKTRAYAANLRCCGSAVRPQADNPAGDRPGPSAARGGRERRDQDPPEHNIKISKGPDDQAPAMSNPDSLPALETPQLPLSVDGGQLSFFSREEENEVAGLSTGQRLFERDRRLYDITVHLLGQDAPIREIKRITGLHHRTIMAVRENEGETIDTLRKSLGRRALRTAVLAVETLEERIMSGDIKSGELAMTAGILIDKGQVLTGGVTARTERVEGERVEDRLKDLLAGLPSADATLITTGIGAGKCSPIGDLGAVIEADLGDGSEGGEDLESSVCPAIDCHVADHVANEGLEMALGSDLDGGGDSERPGEGGGASDGPPIDRGIGKEKTEFSAMGDASAEPKTLEK
jgi:hypothetical protein